MHPKHQRRMKVLREKKGTLKHSEFLSNLERSIGVSEWEKMSIDEFTIHYFVEQSDSILAKEGLEILGKPNPTVAELRSRVAEIENSSWYGTAKHLAKVGKDETTKFCTDCSKSGHVKEECWGRCEYCSKFGHLSKWCKFKPKEEDSEAVRAAKKVEQERKKKKKEEKKARKKKAKKTADVPAGPTAPTTGDNLDSEVS